MSERILAIGTYNEASQQGIHLVAFDPEVGSLRVIGGATGIAHPSFLTFDPKRQCLYAVSETEQGEVVAYQLDAQAGTLRELSRQSTQGGSPCYLTLDETGNWLTAVNYMGGNLSLFPVTQDGSLLPCTDCVQHFGKSVDEDRQEGPHPHSVLADPYSMYYLVCDLGTDHIYLYGRQGDQLVEYGKAPVMPGAGPRHSVVHPNAPYLYVSYELHSTVGVYKFDRMAGTLQHTQSISTLPADWVGTNTVAELQVDERGTRLYVSNRGHDSIATYLIGEDGSLVLAGCTATRGRTPRHFRILSQERCLLVANQDSDSLLVMQFDEHGLPAATDISLKLHKPVCVLSLGS